MLPHRNWSQSNIVVHNHITHPTVCHSTPDMPLHAEKKRYIFHSLPWVTQSESMHRNSLLAATYGCSHQALTCGAGTHNPFSTKNSEFLRASSTLVAHESGSRHHCHHHTISPPSIIVFFQHHFHTDDTPALACCTAVAAVLAGCIPAVGCCTAVAAVLALAIPAVDCPMAVSAVVVSIAPAIRPRESLLFRFVIFPTQPR